jgi:hypothetical protein
MHRTSARALKADVLSTVLGPLAERLHGRRSAHAARLGRPDAYDTETISGLSAPDEIAIALGIIPSASGQGDKLAVRIQDDALVASRDLLGQLFGDLERRTAGEVDFKVIGLAEKGSGSIPSSGGAAAPPTLWHQAKSRPLRPGCSIGHHQITAGTIGGFFKRNEQGDRLFILSNNHILADEDRANIGDPIVQPGPFDGGTIATEQIGKLAAAVPLQGPGNHVPANLVDAAICEVDNGVDCVCSVDGVGAWVTGLRAAKLIDGEEVQKAGRTTAVTQGVVRTIELDNLRVKYDLGVLVFNNQIEIEGNGLGPFATQGDSGSLVLDADRRAFGLLFATTTLGGTHGTGMAYCNPLDEAIKKLGLILPTPLANGELR